MVLCNNSNTNKGMLMRINDLRQTLLNIDEEVYLLHGVIQPKPCVVIVGVRGVFVERPDSACNNARH